MRLHYYRDPVGNFGDDLNPWIWYSLLPELFDDSDDTLFLGIGTIINAGVPTAPDKLVFGAGLGYVGPPRIDDRWEFRFVRGPLTAQGLGLDPTLAITDPAVLVAQLVPERSPEKRTAAAFMPHHVSARHADWRSLCAQAGVAYLDPTGDVHETLFQLRQSRLLICEAMHGAIVADALRIPWVPVRAYGHILEFKWKDWCATVGQSYRPMDLPSVFDGERGHSRLRRSHNGMKRLLRACGVWHSSWQRPSPRCNRASTEASAVEVLASLARGQGALLSPDALHQRNLERVLAEVSALRRHYLCSA